MHDEKKKEENPGGSTDEATSSETLNNLEESEIVSDQPVERDSDLPAPDGAVPSDEGNRKTGDDVEPM